jgi:LuxR family maltose regulon positive regulatory protein
MSKGSMLRVSEPPVSRTLAPIVMTKLIPPRSTARIVGRERLVSLFVESRRKRCVVLRGPAGFGKTTVMMAWRQALLPLDFDVAWLTLSVEDNEPTRWLDYLLASFTRLDPELSGEAALLAGRGTDREAIERTIVALVRSISRHPRQVVLMLDDLHYIADPRIRESLQALLDYSPDNLHFVLSSRGAIPLSLARVRGLGLTVELDMRDLRFSSQETAEFLKAQLGSIGRREAAILHELTDGWVAGLQLICVDHKRRDGIGRAVGPKQLSQLHVQDATAFARYFEDEVLSHLPKAELELLELAAACNRFCASLCAALLGRPAALTEATALLARIEQDNVFILPVEGSDRETWYRFHPLLGEALRERLKNRSTEELHAIHTVAWVWFRNRGLLDEAVHHAVLAGESAAAADLLEQCSDELFTRGELRKLIGLMRRLPAEQVQRHIGLRLWMARSQLYARELSACVASIAQLSADIPKENAQALFDLTIMRATLAVSRDRPDEALAILPALLNPPEETDNVAIGGRNNILSWLYMHRGDFELARQVQFDAPVILVNGSPLLGTAAGSLQGRCLIGLSYAMEGQMAEAERVYRDVLQEAEQAGSECADPAYLAVALLGEVLYETNDVAQALQLLEDRVDVLERVSIPDSVLRVLTVLSASHWLAGRQMEALAYLERLQEYAQNLDLDRLLIHSLGEQVHRRLQRGEFDVAGRRLKDMERIEERYLGAPDEMRYEILLARERAQIRWSLAMGDAATAMEKLEHLIPLCAARGRQLSAVQLRLQAAMINKQLGRDARMRADLLQVLKQGQRLGLVRSLLDVDPAAIDLIAEATLKNEPDPLLSFYVDRLRAAAATGSETLVTPLVASAASGDLLSDRESEVMSLLGQAMPNKKIARMLGLSPETVKWHLKNIYGKLGVASRDEAVARVRDIDVVSRH